jgi:Flp pilus assembly protein TadG
VEAGSISDVNDLDRDLDHASNVLKTEDSIKTCVAPSEKFAMIIDSRSRGSRVPRRGMVVVLMAMLLPLLIGTMALALDGGMLYLQRRQAQTAADAAALAGAYSYSTTLSLSSAQIAAKNAALGNGYTIQTSAITQPVANEIAVTVTASPPRFFSGLWGSGAMTINASATALVSSGSGSTPYSTNSMVLLDGSMSSALALAGSATINASGGIQVNSTSSTAVNANNAGHTSSNISVVGGTTVNSGGSLSGTVNTGASSVGDPLASLATPSAPTASSTNGLAGYPGYGSYTLQPGLYTSSVSLGNGGTFTMQPGLYYFQGGAGLTVANGASLTGSGVTIYTDNSGGTVSFQGGTTTTLSAPGASPTAGAIQGVVYFQGRTSTASPSFGNGASINLTGTFYAAKAPLTFNGGSFSNLASQIIADSANLSNDAQITVPYSASKVAVKAGGYNYPIALIQ